MGKDLNVSLESERVLLRPLTLDDDDALQQVADDYSLWTFGLQDLSKPGELNKYIRQALAERDNGTSAAWVIIDKKNLHELGDEGLALFRNESVGFVFQFHFLLPSMTCRDNILLPARIGGKNFKQVEEDTSKLATILGVTHCLSKYPFEISGGEQQRINIIRALSLRPKILLCDEPTGNLDSKNSEKVTTLLKNLSADFGATLLVVTHDDKVASHFPRKIVIEDGQIIG